MRPPCSKSLLLRLIGLTGLLTLALPAGTAPLARDAAYTNGDRPIERRFSDADLVSSDSRLGNMPEMPINTQEQLLGIGAGRRSRSADAGNFDLGPVTHAPGGSMQDMLRGFITVRRNNAPAQSGPRRADSRTPDSDAVGIDLGLSNNEWVRESVQGVMDTVLRLNVNERGQASFSVLGLGDFSIIISADRSEIAFASNDDVIATARRTADPASGDVRSRVHPGAAGGFASPLGSDPASFDPAESLVERVLQLAWEIASHPLSLILYASILGYGLIWALLSSRAKRSARSGTGHKSRRRHHSLSYAGGDASLAPPVAKKQRKRLRIRIRARKYR